MGDDERYIRGGIVEPRPRQEINRRLFHRHNVHQNSRWENETFALKEIDELRDDFALRGRCEMFRVDLQSMAATEQLHQGTNLRGHQVWARLPHFQRLLTIRNMQPEDDVLGILDFFSNHNDPCLLYTSPSPRD